MGTYHAIAPVDWSKLWREVMPSWYRCLKGKDLKTFADTFVKDRREYDDINDTFFTEVLEEWHRVLKTLPDGWHADFDWLSRSGIFRAFRCEGYAHQEYIEELDATDLLINAVVQHAGVVLSGRDRFSFSPYDRFYSKLHDYPEIQVGWH
jgi:hypothetical protein